MDGLAWPLMVMLHGQVGLWDEVMYVVAAAAGVAVFVALLIAKKGAPEE